MSRHIKFCLLLLLLISFNQLAYASAEIMPNNRQIYIFISSSMPVRSIQQWLQQAKQAHATVVLRGLIHDSFAETTRWIISLQSSDAAGIEIDPTLFQRFHITQVPTVVIVKDNDFVKIAGDIPLMQALAFAKR